MFYFQRVLYKKIILYNPNGEKIAEDYNEQDAFNYLKSITNIKKGFVNIKELRYIENNFTDFNNIISNGKYNVYYYWIDNQKLYFKDYKYALESYRNNINLISAVQVIYKKHYIYGLSIKQKYYEFYWSNLEEIDEIANKIYNLIYKEE
ncbi:hypothetical protein SCHIN_v1c10510 [Spiroplasma chinense]|uniref:Uncharacterized protein n=1 Tax=Spiroplasma chinense TaxID=216932 RepID=A0A5B9Y568_9MOLU|nr:hypothetical protein [Spiroplasma chinense]QEH62244.1 hypothetical protein SCHIN_v1c10510 [Spiroplasma chinense]